MHFIQQKISVEVQSVGPLDHRPKKINESGDFIYFKRSMNPESDSLSLYIYSHCPE